MNDMEGFYQWIRNITYYLIFMTAVVNLLPNKKYEKYFRLFAGMVLILLVLKPFTGGLRLDDKLAYAFESISFQQEASQLKLQLSHMEGKRLESVIGQYEEAVENDLKTMVASSGHVCKKANVVIDGDVKDSSFGRVVSISLVVARAKPETVKDQGKMKTVEPIKSVEPVKVDLGEMESGNKSEENKSEENKSEGNKSAGEGYDRRIEENSAMAGLRRRISEYYNLEEQNIEIQMEDGEG